ncbi:MAG: hypothetical protein ABR541_04635 [Candidatus Dormibacteria bacterium]
MTPGVVLAGLLVLLSAQLTHLMRRRRGRYVVCLLLSAVGLVGGELLAAAGHLGRPTLGVLHPVADAVLIVALQVAGTIVSAPRAG